MPACGMYPVRSWQNFPGEGHNWQLGVGVVEKPAAGDAKPLQSDHKLF